MLATCTPCKVSIGKKYLHAKLRLEFWFPSNQHLSNPTLDPSKQSASILNSIRHWLPSTYMFRMVKRLPPSTLQIHKLRWGSVFYSIHKLRWDNVLASIQASKWVMPPLKQLPLNMLRLRKKFPSKQACFDFILASDSRTNLIALSSKSHFSGYVASKSLHN